MSYYAFSSESGDPNTEEPENQDHDLSFSESLFFKRKPSNKRKETNQNSSATKKQPQAKKSKKTEKADQKSDYFAFLTETQNRDHEFFERLSEKDAKRELKSQQMKFSMVTEIAKIFKGDK